MKPKEGIWSPSQSSRKKDGRGFNFNLNKFYKSDETAILNKHIEDLKMSDFKGEYTTRWKIIHELPGKGEKTSVEVNKRYGTPPTSETDQLAEWIRCLSSLPNNSNSQLPLVLPPPAAQDLPIAILINPPTR